MRRRRWPARCAAPIRRRSCRATTARWRSSTRWRRSPGAAPRRRARCSRRAPPPAPWARSAVSLRRIRCSTRRRRRAGTKPTPTPPSTSIPRAAATRRSPAAGSRSWAARPRCGTAAGSLSLQAGGSRGPRCFSNNEPSDGRISLTYNDPCGEIADESWTLAIGGAYYSSSDMRSINGVSYWKIVKGMIVTDNAPWKYSGLSTGCYEELVAHELGHAIGFGHAADRPALMYPAITTDCGSRSGVDSAVERRSGRDGGALPDATSSPDPPPGTPTGLRRHRLRHHGEPHLDAAVRGHRAAELRALRGHRARPVQRRHGEHEQRPRSSCPNVPDGIYYVRVVAVNSAGSSAPTPDCHRERADCAARRARERDGVHGPRWQRAHLLAAAVHRRRAVELQGARRVYARA